MTKQYQHELNILNVFLLDKKRAVSGEEMFPNWTYNVDTPEMIMIAAISQPKHHIYFNLLKFAKPTAFV